MKPLVEELVNEAGNEEVEVEVCCPTCGGEAQNKGKKKKLVQKLSFRQPTGNHSLILTYALTFFINDESCLLIQHNSYFIRFK